MNILFFSSRKWTKRLFRRVGESVFLFHQPFTDEAIKQGRNASGIFPTPTEIGQTGRTVEHNPGGIPGTRFPRESEEKCPANPRSRRGYWFRKDRHWDYERGGLVSLHQHWSGNACHWCVSHRFCRKEFELFVLPISVGSTILFPTDMAAPSPVPGPKNNFTSLNFDPDLIYEMSLEIKS